MSNRRSDKVRQWSDWAPLKIRKAAQYQISSRLKSEGAEIEGGTDSSSSNNSLVDNRNSGAKTKQLSKTSFLSPPGSCPAPLSDPLWPLHTLCVAGGGASMNMLPCDPLYDPLHALHCTYCDCFHRKVCWSCIDIMYIVNHYCSVYLVHISV